MEDTTFDYIADRFADIQVLRYKIHDFDKLSLKQKQLAYYFTQAGLAGRDIFYDQKYRYGIAQRKTLETILETYTEAKKVVRTGIALLNIAIDFSSLMEIIIIIRQTNLFLQL